ncbi:MAG: hypothetical protein GAK30_01419 [Paracidovorax wautersii]|uniref:DUF1178 family protein n=1 Tax=Paracidovorax wautersii TaxID=1177982 RepID=A0A7V8JQS0_9BURK|nr:MAG: hypothetical protein GAK30_01419 [Paracidovorax wautersii]
MQAWWGGRIIRGMKVLDLQCARQHVFEGWFGSDAEFHSQLERGLVSCPVCGDAQVQRIVSAPRLQRKSNTRSPQAPRAQVAPPAATEGTGEAVVPAEVMRQHQIAYMKAVQHVLKNTEDVGPRFAEEARRMHYGETETRGIRGQASAEDKVALADEGIEVMSLPLPKDMDGPLQ